MEKNQDKIMKHKDFKYSNEIMHALHFGYMERVGLGIELDGMIAYPVLEGTNTCDPER